MYRRDSGGRYGVLLEHQAVETMVFVLELQKWKHLEPVIFTILGTGVLAFICVYNLRLRALFPLY